MQIVGLVPLCCIKGGETSKSPSSICRLQAVLRKRGTMSTHAAKAYKIFTFANETV
jgi:hypothetical protein